MSTSRKTARKTTTPPIPAAAYEVPGTGLLPTCRKFAADIVTYGGVLNVNSEAFAAATDAIAGGPYEQDAYHVIDRIETSNRRLSAQDMAHEFRASLQAALIEAREAAYILGVAVGMEFAGGTLRGAPRPYAGALDGGAR